MKFIIAAAFIAVAYSAPAYDHPPMPYEFAWAVKDDYTYNDYSHQETSDGNGYVKGSYQTLLPDGRLQIVTYTADEYGYNADVQYSGVANYDQQPSYQSAAYKAPVHSAPAYPSPAYKSYAPII